MPAAQTTSLLDVDPDWGQGIDRVDVPLARRSLRLPVVEPAERWPGPQTGAPFLLVTAGIWWRETRIGARRSAELVGPGEIVAATPEPDHLVATDVSWTQLRPVRMVALNQRFDVASRRWPQLVDTLRDRLIQHSARRSLHAALLTLPRVNDRVLGVLLCQAERYGRVAPDGIVLERLFTHDMLGRLAGARRPTVSLALKELEDAGLLVPQGDDWLVTRAGQQASLGGAEPATANAA